MNTIGSNNIFTTPTSLGYDPDDGGCTSTNPRPAQPFHLVDGVDQHAQEPGGTITCPEGTTPKISTKDDGQTVVVVCEQDPPPPKGGPKPKPTKAPILE
jgi:hypothetical protein